MICYDKNRNQDENYDMIGKEMIKYDMFIEILIRYDIC